MIGIGVTINKLSMCMYNEYGLENYNYAIWLQMVRQIFKYFVEYNIIKIKPLIKFTRIVNNCSMWVCIHFHRNVDTLIISDECFLLERRCASIPDNSRTPIYRIFRFVVPVHDLMICTSRTGMNRINCTVKITICDVFILVTLTRISRCNGTTM